MVARRPYADASALVKLVLQEPESEALRQYLTESGDPLTSRVSNVEVHRAIGRALDPPDENAIALLWERVWFIELDADIAIAAARIGPRTLRSLDSIHLASALAVEDGLGAFVTYDSRLADAARGVGLAVAVPI